MNKTPNKPAIVIENNLDTRWVNNTIYNHYEDPMDFVHDIRANIDGCGKEAQKLFKEGEEKLKKLQDFDITYDKLYEDVAKKVKSALIARGFTTKLLYGNVEFTDENTGVMSHHRAMLGRRDCYYRDPKMTDGRLFHDLYINLSYSWSVKDDVIKNNAYALYALCSELSRLLSIRVFVINHVGTDTPTCYSYCLKKFRQPIKPHEFLFFLSDSKRTYGWATYEMLNKNNSNSTVGQPQGSVSIDRFNLEQEIDTIWEKFVQHQAKNGQLIA